MSSYSGYTKPSEKIKVSSLHTATSDYSDDTIDASIKESLSKLKKDLGMDVVFVSEFINGKRVFRYVDTPTNNPVIGVGDSDSLEESWCKYVVDGKIAQYIPDCKKIFGMVTKPPFEIGTHLSIPVVLENGDVYGTLCCFSFTPNGDVQEKDLKGLRDIAKDVSRNIEKNK